MIAQAHVSDFNVSITAALRFFGFLGLIVLLTPVHIVYSACRPQDWHRIPKFFHRLLLRMLGFRVRAHGTMAAAAPILFVANHSSYLDIPVLGSLIPAAFVAKSEVARWPLFGILARLQHTVFVERRAVRAGDHKSDIRARLGQGQNVILFPEGTSSDGLGVLPFKSGLFGAVEEEMANFSLTVQPVSVTCTELDGLPLTRAWRPYYAWFGDMTLAGHLWNAFRLGRFTVDVVFHPPVSPSSFPDRKALATHCQREVARGIERCLTGRKQYLGAGSGTPHVSKVARKA